MGVSQHCVESVVRCVCASFVIVLWRKGRSWRSLDALWTSCYDLSEDPRSDRLWIGSIGERDDLQTGRV